MQNENQYDPLLRREDSNIPPAADPNREPQLNKTVCGCRCGCVSQGDRGGEDSDADRNFLRGEEGAEDNGMAISRPVSPVQGPVRDLFTEFADYEVDVNGYFRLGRKNVNVEHPFRKLQLERQGSPHASDSRVVHVHSSKAQSHSSGHLYSGPSGPVLSAIGTWPGSYVFKPLALAPQHIIPHDAHLPPVGEEFPTSSRVASRYAASNYGYPGSVESGDLEDDE